jgi:hypothetical protein
MSFLATKKASPQSAMVWPTYTGLQLQTSSNSMPIPLMWGMTKLAVNIFFYANFQSHPVYSPEQRTGKGGKGGGWGLQLTGWTYSADLMMALCEGPIVGVNQSWQGQSSYGAQFVTTGCAYGGEGAGPAVVTGGGSSLSSGGVAGTLLGATSAGTGLGALGLTLFNGTTPQATWGYLAANYPTQALAYPGAAYVCAANFGLGSDASIGTLNFEVQGPLFGTGANGLDADPAQVIADFLLNPQYGVGFPGASIDATTLYGSGGDASVQSYCRAMGLCFSPLLNQTESASSVLTRWLQLLSIAAVWSGDRLRFIPYGDATVTGNGVEYVPNLTPAFALTDDDLIYSPGEDPIKVSRLDPFTLANFQWMEMLNRTGVSPGYAPSTILEPQGLPEYQATPISARDQAMIEQYGLRVGSTITAHEFCDINVACVAVQTILQRGLYVRTNFKFALGWEFCLLDPMDIVALTDANLGLAAQPVRIIDIEEDDSGRLSITAEELTIGVSMPAINPSGTSGGGSINTGVAADPVNAPLIFEPPPALTNNAAEIWLGASGGANGVADPNWGGCAVWASLDNVAYQKIATITNPMRQGVLTAPLPLASGYDAADTLAVDLTESAGTLATSTQAAAQAGQTLCLVDGELLGFASATPTAANKYNLAGLPRGMYGSAPAAHAIGAQFARLDGAIAQYALPANFIGKTVYLKFQSFNVFGGGVEDISTCAVYSHVPNGNGQVSQIVLNLQQGIAQDWGYANAPVAQGDDWGTVGNPYYVAVDLGSVSS